MSPFVTSNVTQTSLAPSPTITWHVGISPVFPPSLILTNDAAIESLLTDIPFVSVGLLGFGVLTFFFAMRKFDRLSFYLFTSVIAAFIAGVLDVSQVLIRGREATDSDTNVSSVLPLLVARELALSVSIGIRFFFFWVFVSQPPRGELLLLPTNDFQSQRHNFPHKEFEFHSGNWMRLGYVGGFLKYSLLLAVLLVPLLQILWRAVAGLSNIGPVYNVDSALEVALSTLFIIKLFSNARLSLMTPRWKTIRDYSPVIGALLIGLSVGIGNIMQFQFSETSLGRFFQAVELYILILYVHVASFYQRRTRVSTFGPTMKDRATKASMAFDGIETRDGMSTSQINSAINPETTSVPRNVTGNIIPPPGPLYYRPSNRLSSWLIPEAEQAPVIQGPPRRMSPMVRITSLITGRNSPRQDYVQSRLRTAWGPESGSQQLRESTMALDTPSFGIRNGASPDGTIVSFAAVENYRRDDLTPPTKVPKKTLPESPIHGLDGIMRYHGQPSPLSRPTSVHSSGMGSLLRQQAELDQSVAELQLTSPISVTSGDRLTVPGGLSSVHSDFSLSNFPDPPLNLPDRSVDEEILGVPRVYASDDKQVPSSIIANPRITQSTQSEQRQSFASSSAESSIDTAVLQVASRTILGSGGYDVTSFIGNLSSPESVSQADKSRPISLAVKGSDDTTTSAVWQARAPPLAVIPEIEANPHAKSSPPRLLKQGLPVGVKLNISGPIRQPSIEGSTAYERPRRVPQT